MTYEVNAVHLITQSLLGKGCTPAGTPYLEECLGGTKSQGAVGLHWKYSMTHPLSRKVLLHVFLEVHVAKHSLPPKQTQYLEFGIKYLRPLPQIGHRRGKRFLLNRGPIRIAGNA